MNHQDICLRAGAFAAKLWDFCLGTIILAFWFSAILVAFQNPQEWREMAWPGIVGAATLQFIMGWSRARRAVRQKMPEEGIEFEAKQ